MRRTLLPILAIAFVAIFVANTERAAAQDPYCCTYTINVIGKPAACFPITVTTVWGGGLTRTFTVAANGLYIDNIPNCPPIPAPAFVTATATSAGGCTLTWTWNTTCCLQIVIV